MYYVVKVYFYEYIICMIDNLGGGFDVVLVGEIDLLLKMKVFGCWMIYIYFVKKDQEIWFVLWFGVIIFVVDIVYELEKFVFY